MKRAAKWLAAVVIGLAGLLLVAPGVLYLVGLFFVPSFPTPPDGTSEAAVREAWLSAGGAGLPVGEARRRPMTMEKVNPWEFAWHSFVRCSARPNSSADIHYCVYYFPGYMAAWSVANEHLNKGDLTGRRSFNEELTTTALSIWITRNWSAEQVGAFLARPRS